MNLNALCKSLMSALILALAVWGVWAYAAEAPVCRFNDSLILVPDTSSLPRQDKSALQLFGRPFAGAWQAVFQEESWTPRTTISGCSPEGIWRYEYDNVDYCGTYPYGMPGWAHEHEFCYFRLPRAENGAIVSGDVECRGEHSTFTEGYGNLHCYQPEAHEYSSRTLYFDRRRLEINGLPLEAAQDMQCLWNPPSNKEPLCLWHQDCPNGEFCSWDKGCWDGCKSAGCENEGDLCIGHLNDCRACPLDCRENQTCTLWNDYGRDIPYFENISCSGLCEPACDSNSWCEELTSSCIGCYGGCPAGTVCAPRYGTAADSVLCQSYCAEAGCPEDGAWCWYNSSGECEEVITQQIPSENCDPACPEGFACMTDAGEESGQSWCTNGCQTPGCPEGYILCGLYEGQCIPLIPELNL